MRILFLGDIVGRPGRRAVEKVLPGLLSEYRPDFVLANAENLAGGAGLTGKTLEEMRAAGVGGFTSGNHAFDAKGAEEAFEDVSFPLVRPANWPGRVPGRGSVIIEKNGKKLLLMNVLGRIYSGIPADDPFDAVEKMLESHRDDRPDIKVLDVHAEITSEKRAIAEVFDGRIDLIVGSHTHIQTNDAKTLPKGTGFLTDIGMCGSTDAILGMDKRKAIRRLRTLLPGHLSVAMECPLEVSGCIAEAAGGRTAVKVLRIEGIETNLH